VCVVLYLDGLACKLAVSDGWAQDGDGWTHVGNGWTNAHSGPSLAMSVGEGLFCVRYWLPIEALS